MEEFVVRKSVWSVISFWRILICILIIPLFVLIIRILAVKKEVITFYQDRIVVEKGLLSKKQKSFAFAGVYSVSINKTLWGRMFKYGHVDIDFVGKNDIVTDYVKNPDELVKYLNTKIVKKENTVNIINDNYMHRSF